MSRKFTWGKKIATFPLLVVVTVYIYFVEEFIWDPATRLLIWVRNSPTFLYAIESLKKCKRGWAVLFFFGVPTIVVWPFKLAALLLLGNGYVITGGLLFFIAKVVGTALFAQLYAILGEECEKVTWFHFLAGILRWVRSWVLSHKLYHHIHALLLVLRTKITFQKSFFKQRLRAALKLFRKKRRSKSTVC